MYMRKNIVIQKKSIRIRNRSAGRSGMTEMSRRERVHKIHILFLWLLFFTFLGVCAYFLFFSSYTEIGEVHIDSDSHTVTQDEVISVVNEYGQEKVWHIFLHRNFFFFSVDDMRDRLDHKFLLLSNIHIEKKFPNAVHITFTEREMVAYWCGLQKCFGVDEGGYAFQELPDREVIVANNEKVYPVVVSNDSGDASLGSSVIKKDTLAQYLEWDNFLRSRLGDQFSAMYFDQPQNFEEYQVQTSKNWKIKVARDLSIEDTLRSLYAFLVALPPDRKDILESIDLRVDGKVFFTEKKAEITLEGDGEGDQKDLKDDVETSQIKKE